MRIPIHIMHYPASLISLYVMRMRTRPAHLLDESIWIAGSLVE
jgi:hypothetical protein